MHFPRLIITALVAFGTAATRDHESKPTIPAITADDLKKRLYIIADDSMEGRNAGSEGHVRATNYIAHELRSIGLEPAGDNGTWFQEVPLYRRYADPASYIATVDTRLRLSHDFILFSGNAETRLNDVPVIYGGAIGESTIGSAEASGKVVVYDIHAFKGFSSLRRPPGSESAAAVIIATLDSMPDLYRDYIERDAMELDRSVAPTAGNVPSTVLATTEAVEKLFGSPLNMLRIGTAGANVSGLFARRYGPVAFPARNVVAILRGSDPELSHEYVALGAHSDHLGYSQHPAAHDSMRLYNQIARPGGAEDAKERATPEQIQRINEELKLIRARDTKSARPDSIFNGADDDGSGSAALLEIAQYYASLKPRPRRSILFVWHVGEEEGMLGSNYFTAHTTVPRESIVAQLNVDMIGRGDSSDRTGTDKAGSPLSGSSSYLQLIGSRRLSSELGDIVEAVNKTQKLPFAFDYSLDADGHPEMIYCRSDHYEYARFGIPIVFFSTGGHADYHQVTDEPQYIDYEHYLRVTRLIADVGRVVANLDHRPRVDKQVASGSACVQ